MSRADLELALKSEHDEVIYLRSTLDRQDDIARMKLDKAVAEANYEAYRIGIETVLRFLISILGKDEK